MKRLVFALAVLMTAAAGHAPAQADDCTLHRLGALALSEDSDGSLLLPVTIANQPQRVQLDLTSPVSILYPSYTDSLGLHARQFAPGIKVRSGKALGTGMVTVPDFVIGSVHAKDVPFIRLQPEPAPKGPSVGTVAMDILSNFDIELDIARNALNLYSHDHCEGKVVYWPAQSYAVVPYRTDTMFHPIFRMELDGKSLSVALTTQPGHGRMGFTEAQRLFGIDEHTPGVTPADEVQADQQKLYQYPFKTLSVDGVTILNPAIRLYPNTSKEECRPGTLHEGSVCYGGADMRLGLLELKQLHIFMATKEKVLYVTASQPPTGEPRKTSP